jgi:hypothetical protein
MNANSHECVAWRNKVGRDRRARRGLFKKLLTEDRQGNEATGVGLDQISKQTPFLALDGGFPTALCDLLLKTICRSKPAGFQPRIGGSFAADEHGCRE